MSDGPAHRSGLDDADCTERAAAGRAHADGGSDAHASGAARAAGVGGAGGRSAGGKAAKGGKGPCGAATRQSHNHRHPGSSSARPRAQLPPPHRRWWEGKHATQRVRRAKTWKSVSFSVFPPTEVFYEVRSKHADRQRRREQRRARARSSSTDSQQSLGSQDSQDGAAGDAGGEGNGRRAAAAASAASSGSARPSPAAAAASEDARVEAQLRRALMGVTPAPAEAPKAAPGGKRVGGDRPWDACDRALAVLMVLCAVGIAVTQVLDAAAYTPAVVPPGDWFAREAAGEINSQARRGSTILIDEPVNGARYSLGANVPVQLRTRNFTPGDADVNGGRMALEIDGELHPLPANFEGGVVQLNALSTGEHALRVLIVRPQSAAHEPTADDPVLSEATASFIVEV